MTKTKKDSNQSSGEKGQKAFLFRFLPGFVYDVMPKLKLSEHRILWILVEHAEKDDGSSFCGIDRLCCISKMGRREVRRALKGLIAWGVITTVTKGGWKAGSNRGESTKRRLLIGSGVKLTREELMAWVEEQKGRFTPSNLMGANRAKQVGVNRAKQVGVNRAKGRNDLPPLTPHSTIQKTSHSNSGSSESDSASQSERKGRPSLDEKEPSTPRKRWKQSSRLSAADLGDRDIASPPQRDGEETIVERFAKYRVTAAATIRKRDWEKGAKWCEAILDICDKRREKDDGDSEIASRIAKAYMKDPDKRIEGYDGIGENEPDSEDEVANDRHWDFLKQDEPDEEDDDEDDCDDDDKNLRVRPKTPYVKDENGD